METYIVNNFFAPRRRLTTARKGSNVNTRSAFAHTHTQEYSSIHKKLAHVVNDNGINWNFWTARTNFTTASSSQVQIVVYVRRCAGASITFDLFVDRETFTYFTPARSTTQIANDFRSSH